MKHSKVKNLVRGLPSSKLAPERNKAILLDTIMIVQGLYVVVKMAYCSGENM